MMSSLTVLVARPETRSPGTAATGLSPGPLHRQPLLEVDGRHRVVDHLGIGQIHAGDGTVGMQVSLDFGSPGAGPVLRRLLIVDVDPVAVADRQQDLLAINAEVAEV